MYNCPKNQTEHTPNFTKSEMLALTSQKKASPKSKILSGTSEHKEKGVKLRNSHLLGTFPLIRNHFLTWPLFHVARETLNTS
jgi:hypothetical protein